MERTIMTAAPCRANWRIGGEDIPQFYAIGALPAPYRRRSGQETGGLVEIAVGVAFVQRGDKLAPDEIRRADAETAVMVVVDVGFLNGLEGQSGDFVEAQLNRGIEPDIGRNLAGDARPEAVTLVFVNFDGDVLVAFGCRIAQAG